MTDVCICQGGVGAQSSAGQVGEADAAARAESNSRENDSVSTGHITGVTVIAKTYLELGFGSRRHLLNHGFLVVPDNLFPTIIIKKPYASQRGRKHFLLTKEATLDNPVVPRGGKKRLWVGWDCGWGNQIELGGDEKSKWAGGIFFFRDGWLRRILSFLRVSLCFAW